MAAIRLFLTDCDGCLTDGGMYYSEAGDELKRFDTRDGMGIALLRGRGVACGVVTSEDRELNRRRADKLRLDYLVQGCADKLPAIREICEGLGIGLEQVAYVGDDLNDCETLAAAGRSFCPADAQPCAREAAQVTLDTPGGHGAVREAAERLIREGLV